MADTGIYTVSEITREIKQHLESEFPSVAIQGELSNFKVHTSGHLYFTLKDGDAQISGVMWRSRAANLAFAPQDGMKVVVAGRIAVYEVRGVYQVDTWSLRPLGVGELQAAFERLKQKLAAEGLFDVSRKRTLPVYPERIGIVTSPTGAALHDMLTIIRRRFPGLEVIVCPVKVQGMGAAEEIAQAIRDLNDLGTVDVMIVGRGGGSMEDLWAFNEEIVARAIAGSRVPVVSAVGHEIDFTIADFVADLRAPTPSAAAELVVQDSRAVLDLLRNNWYTMQNCLADQLNRHRTSITHLLNSYSFNRPIDLLHQCSQRFDELARSLSLSGSHKLAMTSARAQSLHQRLTALDPQLALKRGYAIIYKEGSIVMSKVQVQAEDQVEIRFHDGTVRSTISRV
jgi:exodeoxyribonuclease VII large subunit